MKKSGIVFTAVLAVIGLVLAFFAGGYMRDRTYKERRAEAFDHYISVAIETTAQKGLGISGAAEFVASNLWTAHALCSSPEASAELSDLWNSLVYEKEAFAGREDVLIEQLNGMLKN